MITVPSSERRLHRVQGVVERLMTFRAARDGDPGQSFGTLVKLDEVVVPPGGVLETVDDPALETLIYVEEGAIQMVEAADGARLFLAGDFAVGAMEHTATNPSPTRLARLFEIGFRARPRAAHRQTRHFSAAERRGRLLAVASPDGRGGSLTLGGNVSVYSALLETGHHVAHELVAGRQGWVQIVKGSAALDDTLLSGGDGAAVVADRCVSLTARTSVEVLLIDLACETSGP